MNRFIVRQFATPAANSAYSVAMLLAPFKAYRITHIACTVTNSDASARQLSLRIGTVSNTGELRMPGNSIAAGISATQTWNLSSFTTGAAGSNGDIVANGLPNVWFENDKQIRIDVVNGAAYQLDDLTIVIEAIE